MKAFNKRSKPNGNWIRQNRKKIRTLFQLEDLMNQRIQAAFMRMFG